MRTITGSPPLQRNRILSTSRDILLHSFLSLSLSQCSKQVCGERAGSHRGFIPETRSTRWNARNDKQKSGFDPAANFLLPERPNLVAPDGRDTRSGLTLGDGRRVSAGILAAMLTMFRERRKDIPLTRSRRIANMSFLARARGENLRRFRTRAATGPDAHAPRTTVVQHCLRSVECLDAHWINRDSWPPPPRA